MNLKKLFDTSLHVSRFIYGCMRLGGSWDSSPISKDTQEKALQAIEAALEVGINFFDHADIYCCGKSEQVFSQIWKGHPGLRDQVVLQSKCGICLPHESNIGRYDLSYKHIIRSVEGSLKRLDTDYLDILLLHRPDPLVEPEEVAKAFDELQSSGKVRYFGVSNHTSMQIALLQKNIRQKLLINQIQLSLLHSYVLEMGIAVTDINEPMGHAGILEYCRLHQISLQAWSPLAGGQLFQPHLSKLQNLLSNFAEQKQVTPYAIAIAWLLRHPAQIQPVIGTTDPEKISAICAADTVEMSKDQWYQLYVCARGVPLP